MKIAQNILTIVMEKKMMNEEKEIYKFDYKFVLKELENYNLYCENMTIMTIFSLLQKGRFNTMNTGQAGVGKSRSTLELVRMLNLNDIVCLSGHISPLKFFELLEQNPKATILIDESAQTFEVKEIIHLLRIHIELGTAM